MLSSYDSHINYWVSEPDRGVYHAMNKGIEQAKGEYVLFLNSGDSLYSADVLGKMLTENTNSDFVYGNLVRIFPDGRRDKVEMPEELTLDFLLISTLCHPVTFIKRNLFDKFGLYEEDFPVVADWVFFIRVIILHKITTEYKNVDVTLFKMDGLSSRLSNQPVIANERKIAIKKYIPDIILNDMKRQKEYKYYYHVYLHSRKYKLFRKISQPLTILYKKIQYAWNSLETFLYMQINRKRLHGFYKNIPVIINNRNHFLYLQRLISSLEKRGYTNIYIIDNASDYPPLLEYYNSLSYKIYYLEENVGHYSLWDTYVYEDFKDNFYVFTDSDVELADDCPDDFMLLLYHLVCKYRKKVYKAGFSLAFTDLPDYYKNKENVEKWERDFYTIRIEERAYLSSIDTTFALYRKDSFKGGLMYEAIRTPFPYAARHLPWYENSNHLTEEQIYYYEHIRKNMTHWGK